MTQDWTKLAADLDEQPSGQISAFFAIDPNRTQPPRQSARLLGGDRLSVPISFLSRSRPRPARSGPRPRQEPAR
jgi:hypothetical protein